MKSFSVTFEGLQDFLVKMRSQTIGHLRIFKNYKRQCFIWDPETLRRIKRQQQSSFQSLTIHSSFLFFDEISCQKHHKLRADTIVREYDLGHFWVTQQDQKLSKATGNTCSTVFIISFCRGWNKDSWSLFLFFFLTSHYMYKKISTLQSF